MGSYLLWYNNTLRDRLNYDDDDEHVDSIRSLKYSKNNFGLREVVSLKKQPQINFFFSSLIRIPSNYLTVNISMAIDKIVYFYKRFHVFTFNWNHSTDKFNLNRIFRLSSTSSSKNFVSNVNPSDTVVAFFNVTNSSHYKYVKTTTKRLTSHCIQFASIQ